MEILIYQTLAGKEPFLDFINTLDMLHHKKVMEAVRKLGEDNFGKAKNLKGVAGISELKIDFKVGYRVYFTQISNKVVILLIAGTKKTQTQDIKKAKEYLKEYKERYKE